MTSFVWSQESQQEKLEERKAQIQKEIRENEKLLQSVKKKEKSAVNVVVIDPKLHMPNDPDTLTTGIGLMVRVMVFVAGAH